MSSIFRIPAGKYFEKSDTTKIGAKQDPSKIIVTGMAFERSGVRPLAMEAVKIPSQLHPIAAGLGMETSYTGPAA